MLGRLKALTSEDILQGARLRGCDVSLYDNDPTACGLVSEAVLYWMTEWKTNLKALSLKTTTSHTIQDFYAETRVWHFRLGHRSMQTEDRLDGHVKTPPLPVFPGHSFVMFVHKGTFGLVHSYRGHYPITVSHISVQRFLALISIVSQLHQKVRVDGAFVKAWYALTGVGIEKWLGLMFRSATNWHLKGYSNR